MTVAADAWGLPVTHGAAGSLDAWNGVLRALLSFRGDPLGLAAAAADADLHLPMARIAAATMLLLSGESPHAVRVRAWMSAAAGLMPAATGRERRHWGALQAVAAGEFTAAARHWDAILADHPGDMFALKMSHEAFFIAGATAEMLASAARAVQAWDHAVPGIGFAIGQHAFALEESGYYADAERAARAALDVEPDDLWSAHALAHVFEMQDRQGEALAFLGATRERWSSQTLAGHMYWHLALRHLAANDHAAALQVHDRELASSPPSDWFRLTDATSLLWRLDLAGADTGDRWQALADKWRDYGGRHTSPFLDLHAAMAFAKVGVEASGFDAAPFPSSSEMALTLRQVAEPLCSSMYPFCAEDWQRTVTFLVPLLDDLHRIGGSAAQRQTVHLTYAMALQRLKPNV